MEPFLGQIQAFGFNFAPRGWAFCNGQLIAIMQNQALYSLLGTIYGGDGRSTFALPDLRGRISLHQGNGPGLSDYTIGEKAGAERVTLTTYELPSHTHTAKVVATSPNSAKPSGTSIATPDSEVYSTANPDTDLNIKTIGNTGGGQSHENRPPFLVINWCIALQGVFPSRS
jgi:microcystin-dependent protein